MVNNDYENTNDSNDSNDSSDSNDSYSDSSIDSDEEIDTTTLYKLKDEEEKYNDFYKEPVKSVLVYLLYIDKNNELDHIHKDRCIIDNDNGILRNDIIISFINKYHKTFSNNYKFFSILKYNIDIDPSEIEQFSDVNNEIKYNNLFFTIETYLNNINFNPSIQMFQDLNALYFIFNETTKPNETPKHNQTKRIILCNKKNISSNKYTKRKKINNTNIKILKEKL